MINLTKKAAGRFRIRWSDLSEQKGDNWKVDVIMVSRYPVLLIVHEYTLYTLVRKKSDFKTLEAVAREIREKCPWYRFPETMTTGKNSDRKLVGSMTEMKMGIIGEYSMNFTEEIQKQINGTLFSVLSEEKYHYGRPRQAVERYKKGEWPPGVKVGK